MQLTLVDVDTRALISAWVLLLAAEPPAVSRSYEVEVTRSVDRGVHKKIVFRNPWDTPRRFVLRSSDEAVMVPKTPLLDVAGSGSAFLRLWFSAAGEDGATGPIVREVHLFLTDAVTGQAEDCFLFIVRDVHQSSG
jgi:hypothetical protein